MNSFELFQETPRPYLDLESLKQKFLKFSVPVHPDKIHQFSESEKREATKNFAELNRAYASLVDVKERLFLLIKLETDNVPSVIQSIPEDVSNLVIEIGKACQEFDAQKTSLAADEPAPLLKAMAQRKRQSWFLTLDKLRQVMMEQEGLAIAELMELDEKWMTSDHAALIVSLEKLGRRFSFIKKWSQQLDERLLQLKFLTGS